MKPTLLITAFATAMISASSAAVISLKLDGAAGEGLLVGNTNGSASSGGSGGALGLSYDDATNVFSYSLVWGSGNGFTDLSSAITVAHIHGPTASPAPASFSENGGVAFNLITAPTANFDSSITNGSADGTWTLSETEEVQLLDGQFYFNIHTINNSGGEIRGYAVPEPSHASFALVGLLALGFARRRRQG